MRCPQLLALATLALVVLCTAFAYQLYYYLVISAGPLQALTVTLLIPVFGLIWGALLLDESISAGHDSRLGDCALQRRLGNGDDFTAGSAALAK